MYLVVDIFPFVFHFRATFLPKHLYKYLLLQSFVPRSKDTFKVTGWYKVQTDKFGLYFLYSRAYVAFFKLLRVICMIPSEIYVGQILLKVSLASADYPKT